MATNYIAEGNVLRVTLDATYESGDPILVGRTFGVCLSDGVSGDTISVAVDGVFSLPKDNSTIEQGDALYLDTSDLTLSGDPATSTIVVGSAYSDAGSSATTVECRLQQIAESYDGLGLTDLGYVHEASGTFRAVFDVGAGKAIGAHTFGMSLPDNCIITQAAYQVTETFTSSTDAATIALGVQTDDAAGLVAAVAVSNGANPWDAGTPVQTLADLATVADWTTQTTASGRKLVATVAVEALTAGRLIVFGRFIQSE